MSKRKEITSYFQPKKKQTTTCEDEEPSAASIEVTGDGVEPLILGGINSNSEQHPQNPEIVNEGIDSENTDEIIDFNSLIRDPGLRKQIETYHPNKKDLIRRAYIDLGPYQPVQVYPFSGPEHHPRRFQKSWFDKFPWLEYSPEKDAAYCFYCFLFAKNPLVNMSKRKEITSYFQPKKKQTTTCEDEEPSAASIEVTGDGVEPLILGGINSNSEQHPQNPEIVNEGIDSENTDEIIDFNSLIRDPGLRKQIETYHPNKKDLIRRAYIDLGPYQPVQVYPFSGPEHHPRRFQKSWFDKFPWLEYSPEKDAAYCFYCFLFAKNPLGRCGSNTFTVKGFNSWRKVNNGKDCAFRCHVGKGDGSNSAHNFAAKCYYNLKNQPCHLEKIVEKQSA
ncbi:hypothetical protein POM88_051190 [Heracleum sosnowskyi]|uniref:TTF-type domain-containing protein n=1 Tax=Heracleum sosnowskyi TaxID=360622 RepID=A0AAD8M341_9APIA|nr:hypothetical protein POM88_051190 [Heracleum sosnowskyi]